jgi:hypothetical protein
VLERRAHLETANPESDRRLPAREIALAQPGVGEHERDGGGSEEYESAGGLDVEEPRQRLDEAVDRFPRGGFVDRGLRFHGAV